MTPRLWEYKHPYSMQEGCHYTNPSESHKDYGTWKAFESDWLYSDEDLNRVHRWDYSADRKFITIYYIMQRKAYTYSCTVAVEDSDHGRIRAFLKPHAELNRKLWEGVL